MDDSAPDDVRSAARRTPQAAANNIAGENERAAGDRRRRSDSCTVEQQGSRPRSGQKARRSISRQHEIDASLALSDANAQSRGSRGSRSDRDSCEIRVNRDIYASRKKSVFSRGGG